MTDYEYEQSLPQNNPGVHPILEKINRTERHAAIAERIGSVSLDGYKPMGEAENPITLQVRDALEAAIIGQPKAVDAIISALDRADMRLKSDTRPIATFAFLGPTGTGKSETGRVLAKVLGGGEPNLIKIDCSEYSHGHEVTKLVGAPPSFKGYEQEPLLSKERVEGHPGTVVMFDEVEKGSDELFNLLLQVTDSGELTDAKGTKINFRNTIVIFTSNLGAREMSSQLASMSLGFGDRSVKTDESSLETTAIKAFKEFFSPEFYNRITKSVVFRSLDNDGMMTLLHQKVQEANTELVEQHSIAVELSDEAMRRLVSEAMKQQGLGARPLVRSLDELIFSELGRYKVSDKFVEGTRVKVWHESEVPEQFKEFARNSLVFTSKADSSIPKKPILLPVKITTPPFLSPIKPQHIETVSNFP